jgi:hypothetical protein
MLLWLFCNDGFPVSELSSALYPFSRLVGLPLKGISALEADTAIIVVKAEALAVDAQPPVHR